MLFALSFVMPAVSVLINDALLLAFLSLIGWLLVTYVAKADPAKTVVLAIGALILIVVLLQTFTTWRG